MPKIVDSDQYRKELLHKCFDIFAEKGYGEVTTRQLAQELGVSTGTLYHYFPSKAALFEQLVEELSQQDVLMVAAELEKAKTLKERLYVLGQFLVKNEDYFIKQYFVWVDFCQRQDREKMQNSKFFQQVNQRYQQAIADFLGITEPAIAWFVLSLINGIILERLLGNQKVSLVEQVDLLGKMLTAYLGQVDRMNLSNRVDS